MFIILYAGDWFESDTQEVFCFLLHLTSVKTTRVTRWGLDWNLLRLLTSKHIWLVQHFNILLLKLCVCILIIFHMKKQWADCTKYCWRSGFLQYKLSCKLIYILFSFALARLNYLGFVLTSSQTLIDLKNMSWFKLQICYNSLTYN